MYTNCFHRILSAELFKLKNNLVRNFFCLFPVIITLPIAIFIYCKFSNLTSNPWMIMGNYCFRLYALLYPMIIAFVVYAFQNVEQKNNTYKQLFVFPVSKLKLYAAKWCVSMFYMLISVLIAFISFYLAGIILGSLRPDLAFSYYNIDNVIYVFFVRLFIAAICVVSIQNVISILFHQFIVSVSIATIGCIFGFLFYMWEYIDYYPYMYILIAFLDFYDESDILFSQANIIALCYTMVFSIGGYFVFKIKYKYNAL
jgi:hypothetical protein